MGAYAQAPQEVDKESPHVERETFVPRNAGKFKVHILLPSLFLLAFATTYFCGSERMLQNLTLPSSKTSEKAPEASEKSSKENKYLLAACSPLTADPGLMDTCQEALVKLSAVKERIGRQLANDLHMWENTWLGDLPWGVRERVAKESVAVLGSRSTSRLKEQVVAALLGAPTGIVTLGGSNSVAVYLMTLGLPLNTLNGSYSAYLGAWWNETFPHPDNYVKNSAITAASGTAPLLCLDRVLGPYPGIVTVEFNVNPTKESDAVRLMDALTHNKLASRATILNLELPYCLYNTKFGIESCWDNIGTVRSSKQFQPWAANWTDISLRKNITSLSMSKGLAPYWTGNRTHLPEFYRGTGPLELFSFNDTTGLTWIHHINHRGHELVGVALVRHIMDVVLDVSPEEVVHVLHSGFDLHKWLAVAATQPEIDDPSSLCFATAWSFLEKMRYAKLTDSLVTSEGWAVEDTSEKRWVKKETLAAKKSGAHAAFRLDLPTPGTLMVAYFHSDFSGIARLAMIDSRGRKYSHLIDAGLTSQSAARVHMIDVFMDDTILPAGPLMCNFTVVDSRTDGFQLVGLFVDGDKSVRLDLENNTAR